MANEPCFTCDIAAEYVSLANRYTQDMSSTLVEPMWLLFGSIAGLWIVIQALRLGLHQTTIMDLIKEFFFVMIAAVLLSGQGPGLVNSIYEASLGMMGSAASMALMVGGQEQINADPTVIGSGMEALVRTSEKAIMGVFSVAWRIAAAWSITTPLMIIYALILIAPYFLLWIAYFGQVVVSIFRIMMLSALSPFMMLGFGFGWGRDMAKAGIRTLIASFIVLFASTAVIAVLMYALDNLNIAKMATDDEIRAMADITNPKFMLAVAMGWLGTAFLTEATGLANSITGSSLTNQAVATIVAGAAGTALALGKAQSTKALATAAGGVAGGAAATAVGVGANLAGKAAGQIPGAEAAYDAAEKGVSLAGKSASQIVAQIKQMRGY